MKMEIAPDEPLDYVEFRISPDERYYAFICSGDKEEKIGSAFIDQLTSHLPKELYSESEESYADFKLETPDSPGDATWFTKSTLIRFLKMTDSSDAIKKTFAISNEMSQLEEARKFHISLYVQDHSYKNDLVDNGADNCDPDGANQRPKEDIGLSDNSKNELLRAMDLRLSALGEELVAAFMLAVGSACSSEEIQNLEKFCKHFGVADLSNVLSKLIGVDVRTTVGAEVSSTGDDPSKMANNARISKLSSVDQPVKYGASPAKAAQIERQSYTDSENSSCSSEEDVPSADRSRTMTRSATPRRSASPMRRVQIGRSGSRRTPAIAIKSLSYFPGRDKAFLSKGGETDESDQPRVPESSNSRRMSVQDAISLFERKQKDQVTDAPKWRSQADNPANAPKAVLRRWSSGMSEASGQFLEQSGSTHTPSAASNDMLDEAPSNNPAGAQAAGDSEAPAEAGKEMETSKQSSPSPNHADAPVTHMEGGDEKLGSVEWSRQKEAELNQMLMSFVQKKPSKYQATQAGESKIPDFRTLQNKERKNQKIQGENTKKRAEKTGQPKVTRKALDKAKPENSPRNISGAGKKQPVSKTQKEKVVKSMPLSANSKRELPRPAVQKVPSKPSSLPATRKSWPLSTPTPRTAGTLPAKPLKGAPPPSGATVPRQKSQSPASLSRLTPKLETPQQKKKEARKTQVDSNKSTKSLDENKRQAAPTSTKSTKTKGSVASSDNSAAVPVKPIRSKVAKKSSVVPLESKPATQKSSRIGTGKTSAVSKKVRSSPVKEALKSEVVSEKAVRVQEHETGPIVSGPVPEHVERDLEVEELIHHTGLEPESHVKTPSTAEETEASSDVPAKVDESKERTTESSSEIQPDDEPIISPSAWVENDNHDLPGVSGESACQTESPANLEAASAGLRVRHSLSQMLLEESSEPDIIEWGNAENPPAIVYQKDAPKGLKRLLKFARKSRGDANVAGWYSSPYASEGEDDGDESKAFSKKNSDNLLRKAALNATQHGPYGISSDGHERILADSEPLSGSNGNNLSVLEGVRLRTADPSEVLTWLSRDQTRVTALSRAQPQPPQERRGRSSHSPHSEAAKRPKQSCDKTSEAPEALPST